MIKDIKIGSSSFVLFENGDLWGCGSNSWGKLGLGHTEQVNIFTKICEKVEKIECYSTTTFLFKKDKTLWFTGEGSYLDKMKNTTSFVKIVDDVKSILYWGSPKEKKFLFCLKNNGELLDLMGHKTSSSNIEKIIKGYKGEQSCLFIIKKDNSFFYFEGDAFDKIDFFNKVKNIFSDYKTPVFIQKIDDTLWQTKDCDFEKSVKIFDDIKDVKVFSNKFFFLKKDGDLFALGKNDYGELGADQKIVNVPVLVARDVKEFYSNLRSTFILKKDNSLWGCGENYYNILGNEPVEHKFYSFKKICDNVKKFYIDSDSLFIIKQDGELLVSGKVTKYFKGDDYLKFASSDVENVFSNSLSFFILKKNNVLLCFGNNNWGQLGVGSEKNEVNEPTVCIAIKKYYDAKETIKVIKDIFKGESL